MKMSGLGWEMKEIDLTLKDYLGLQLQTVRRQVDACW